MTSMAGSGLVLLGGVVAERGMPPALMVFSRGAGLEDLDSRWFTLERGEKRPLVESRSAEGERGREHI